MRTVLIPNHVNCDSRGGFPTRAGCDCEWGEQHEVRHGCPPAAAFGTSRRLIFGSARGGPATRIRRGGGWRWRRSTTAARAATRRGSAGWGCRSCVTGGEIQRGRPRRPDRPQGAGSVAAIEHPSGRPWRRWSRAGRFPPCMAWCAGGWPIWPSGSGPVGLAQWVWEEFRSAVSAQTVSRDLRALG